MKTKLKWTNKTIRLVNGSEKLDEFVEAHIYSDLAIHQMIEEGITQRYRNWRITHVPTGYAIKTLPNKKEARALIVALVKKFDWNFTDLQKVPMDCPKFMREWLADRKK